jgi:hypothetical protein
MQLPPLELLDKPLALRVTLIKLFRHSADNHPSRTAELGRHEGITATLSNFTVELSLSCYPARGATKNVTTSTLKI